MKEKFLGINTATTPPTLAGFFFCLASAKGAGLLFCPAAIKSHTSVYSGFCHVHAVIPPTLQNCAHGFTGAFLLFAQFYRPRYQTDTSGYNTTCATLERLPVPGRFAPIPDTAATPDTVQASAAPYSQPHYYNKVYIRACPCYGSMPDDAAHRKPCQPGKISMLPRQAKVPEPD